MDELDSHQTIEAREDDCTRPADLELDHTLESEI